MGYRKTEHDLRYYSSDLSKWIASNCSKEMTSINLDVLQIKKSAKKTRLIEYKHLSEGMDKGQHDALTFLAGVFKYLNMVKLFGTFEVVIVRADFDCEGRLTGEALVEDLIAGERKRMGAEELRCFLDFRPYVPPERKKQQLAELERILG